MSWFSNLSFRYKAIIPVGIIAAIMGVIAALALVLLANIGVRATELADKDLPSVNNLTQADRDLNRVLVMERSLLFLDVDDDRYKNAVAEHDKAMKEARDHIAAYAAITTNAKNLELLKKYQDYHERWEKITNEIVKQRNADTRIGRSTAMDLSFKDGSDMFAKMRKVLEQLIDNTVSTTKAVGQETTDSISSSRITLLVCLLIGLIMCSVLAMMAPKFIVAPLVKVIDRLEDLADGNGDLTARLDVDSKDEVGRLSSIFNRFIEKLQGLIKEISSSTGHLSGAASQLEDLAAQSASAVQDQQGNISQVAAAMHEMNTTAQDVARNATSAASVTTQASQEAEGGKGVVSHAVKSINGLADEIAKAADVIQKLSAESEQIGKVLVVIKGIADQTNLLALNAAIEAARAGEQGRGFAVVADEVRTLASRTQGSTQEIQDMIASLQEMAHQAVKVMEESRTQVSEGVDQVSKAGDSFDAITQAIVTINDMNTQIASAAEEQTLVSEEISRNVQHVNDSASISAQISGQAKEASDSVTQMAETLQRQVGRFKV